MKIGWIFQNQWLHRQKDGRSILATLNHSDIPYQSFNWREHDAVFHQWNQKRHGLADIVGLIGEIPFVQQFHKNYSGPPLQIYYANKLSLSEFQKISKELELMGHVKEIKS